ncbi:radical SAM protein [Streptomyces aidingensis]|uniref:Radical SAM superfamily protein n=1 Tax=Streptomyces aidingensis TaxID=910347 RepID=A0A1I1V4G1_9ACTN|nr:radical SAM protein [Streptomyces aidingensis]SFD77932.1 Radical SAM superfamily protein [Streptomyces aidingensis]
MRSVILSAGKSCFVACPGCYNYFGRTVSDTSVVTGFVAGLCDRFALKKITVGGGDPLTRPDIIPLLKGLRGLGLRISLDTVGTAFLGPAAIRFMGEGMAAHVPAEDVVSVADVIGIPLDGSTDEVQQRFRRQATVHSQLKILSLLDKARARLCVNTVVHAGNTEDTSAIARLLHGYSGICEWQLFQFMPMGPLGHRNRDEFAIPESTFEHAVQRAQADAPRHVRVVAKSVSSRKHRYVLIDSAGLVWIPDQSQGTGWQIEDTNDRRRRIGSISDPDIHDRLAALDKTHTVVPA